MTFKFWNCITCSQYFLQKPEVVFRVHYPHLFTGQPDWLYQAAVCLKCYHNLPAIVASETSSVPDSLTHGTFTVIDCKTEKECSTTTVDSDSTSTVNSTPDIKTADEQGAAESPGGNPPSTGVIEKQAVSRNGVGMSTSVSLHIGRDTAVVHMEGNGKANHQNEVTTSRSSPPLNSPFQEPSTGNPPLNTNHRTSREPGNPPSNLFQISQECSKDSMTLMSPDSGNHLSKMVTEHTAMPTSKGNPLYLNKEQIKGDKTNLTKFQEENHSDNKESYKCYVCNTSVSITSPHGKLRRSKFPSLFNDVPDNVGHFKVCQLCFDRLDQQREQYIKANIPDEERNYFTFIKKSETTNKLQGVNLCFVCEEILDREPCRLIFRSRYPSMFRGLPEHVIYVPLCDKCYKKLQKVKLRYDRSQYDEEARNYIHFVNLWRAKRGLGTHPVLV